MLQLKHVKAQLIFMLIGLGLALFAFLAEHGAIVFFQGKTRINNEWEI